ncbi:MFS transporter [Paenibacillus sp. HJL G12]|uniref:MFS transporter n=1 Tax=Paenibacillus dendrobii TaxID=2691084 RepID=A0A7X3II20_9BACL|nr:MFS transporter [Paenibacillus dendrobii]MWV43918.1 MFS transporter [Paenibacillus dendrobii]
MESTTTSAAVRSRSFWPLVLTGMFLIIATTGLSRVAFGAVLPYMKTGLGLSNSEAGLLGTMMFLGYLITVGLSGPLTMKWGAKKVLFIGGWGVVISLFALATAPSFSLACISILIMGGGSALVFTPLVSIMIASFPDRRGIVLGLLLSGAGIGMFLSGIVVPLIVLHAPQPGYRRVWLIFAIFSLLVLIASSVVLRRVSPANSAQAGAPQKTNWFRNKNILLTACLYFAVGMAYLVPLLYQTSYMIKLDFSDTIAGLCFSVSGIFGVIGGPGWGALSDRIGLRKALILSILAAIAGNVLPVLFENLISFLISGALLGSTIGGIATLIQAKASHQVPQRYVSVVIGFISVFYAVGQMLGPILAGVFIEFGGGFASAYLFGAAVYLLGLLLEVCFKPKKSEAARKSAEANAAR